MRSRVHIAIGMAVTAALVALAVVIWVDRMQPVEILIQESTGETIHVSVTGAVTSPGVVEVPLGARLQEVVKAAGGFTADANTDVLNLAGRVGDGEQVEIPPIGEAQIPATSNAPVDGLIDINTATITELDELPGIGDVLGGRIIAYREENGPFTSIDELSNVEGISTGLVDEIRPYVTVSPGG